VADFTLDDVFADLEAEQQSTKFTLEDVIQDVTPKEKPSAIQRFTQNVQSVTESLTPPIISNPIETVKKAFRTAVESKTTERDRLRGVFEEGLQGLPAGLRKAFELASPAGIKELDVPDAAARVVSAGRTLFGVPFEAGAPPVVTEGVGTALEFVGEKAEQGALGLGFSEATARAIGEIAPDIAAVALPVGAKAGFRRIAGKRKTPASPDVRQPTKATAPEPAVEARPGAPERLPEGVQQIQEFLKDAEAPGKPAAREVTPAEFGLMDTFREAAGANDAAIVGSTARKGKALPGDLDIALDFGEGKQATLGQLKAVRAKLEELGATDIKSVDGLKRMKATLPDGQKVDIIFSKPKAEKGPSVRRPPLKAKPGETPEAFAERVRQRAGGEPEAPVLKKPPSTTYILEEGAEPRVGGSPAKGKKSMVVEIDHLGGEPRFIAAEGLTPGSGKTFFAEQIAGIRARTQGFSRLERAIGEKASSKQIKDFPNQYVDKGLALDVQTNITNSAVGFMIRNKIPLKADTPVSLQLVKAMAENPKLNEAFAADLQKVGITREQFLKSYVSAKSIAGKTLADLSVAERRLRRELGENNPLVKEIAKQKAEMSGWDLGWHYFNRWTDVWRGSLVTRIKTAVRNLETQVTRLGIESIEGAMDSAIRKQFNLGEKPQAPSMRPIFDVFKTLVSKDRIKTAEKILELNPDIKDNMFRRYNSDVAFDPDLAPGVLTKFEKVTRGAETTVKFQNTMNWWQEFLIRKTAFYDDLARRLESKGLNIDKIDPKKIDIKDLTAASEHALEVTFAKTPTGNIGRGILNIYKVVPPLKLIAPFARFMINSWDFVYQRNPAAFLKFLSKAERAKLKAGDTRTMTKAIMGSALTLAAYQLRKSDIAGDQWYQLKAGGKVWDMRPFNPFASYLFIADLADKILTGNLDELSGKALAQGLFSANFRAGGGLLVIESVADTIAGLLAQEGIEAAAKEMVKFAGETVGGFFTQFRTVKSFIQAFSEEESKLRDKRDSPFLGPIADAIPFVSRTLPERQFPLGKPEGATTEIPLVSELTGVLGRSETPAQSEASRLKLTLRDLQRGTGIAKLDRLTAQHARPRAERRIERLIKSASYQRKSKPEQVVDFKKAMNGIINSSRSIIMSRRENRDLRDEFRLKKRGKERVKADVARRERLGLPAQ